MNDHDPQLGGSGMTFVQREYPWMIYQYTGIIALSSLAMGYTVSNIITAILYIPVSIPLNTLATTMVISLILVGGFIGTFVSGFVADCWGRRSVLALSGVVGLIATVGTGLATKSWQLILGRFLSGLATGATSVMTGLFLAETCPPDVRGRLQGYGHLAGWVGGIMAHLVGIIMIFTLPPHYSWRLIFFTGVLFYLPALILTLYYLPESPRWLIVNGKHSDAAREILRGVYGPANADVMEDEFQNMQHSITKRTEQAQGKELFKREYRRPLMMACVVQTLQQLSGNNVITFYSAIILHRLGFTREESVLLTGLSIIPQVLIIWYVVHQLDRIGRRRPLLYSLFGSGLSLVLLAAVSAFGKVGRMITWLSLVGILLNRIFFSVGLGPLPTVVTAEILPYAVRGRGLSATMSIAEVIKIIFVMAFLPLVGVLNVAYLYGFLAISMFVGFLYILLVLRETRGKSIDVTTAATTPLELPVSMIKVLRENKTLPEDQEAHKTDSIE